MYQAKKRIDNDYHKTQAVVDDGCPLYAKAEINKIWDFFFHSLYLKGQSRAGSFVQLFCSINKT